MKKVGVLCVSLCLPLLFLAGCGGSRASSYTQPEEDALNLAELYDAGMASFESAGVEAPVLFQETDLDYISNFYPGIQDVELEQYCFAMAPVTNAPMEIALVEVASEADAQTVIDIFQARVEERSADGAYTEEAAVWKNNARVTSRGRYVFLAVLTDDYVMPEEFVLE